MKKSCRLFEYARASAYNLFNQRKKPTTITTRIRGDT